MARPIITPASLAAVRLIDSVLVKLTPLMMVDAQQVSQHEQRAAHLSRRSAHHMDIVCLSTVHYIGKTPLSAPSRSDSWRSGDLRGSRTHHRYHRPQMHWIVASLGRWSGMVLIQCNMLLYQGGSSAVLLAQFLAGYTPPVSMVTLRRLILRRLVLVLCCLLSVLQDQLCHCSCSTVLGCACVCNTIHTRQI